AADRRSDGASCPRANGASAGGGDCVRDAALRWNGASVSISGDGYIPATALASVELFAVPLGVTQAMDCPQARCRSAVTPLRRCTRCTIPETHETITFDAEGVCNICRQHETKHALIDWDARRREFAELIESQRGKHSHDCIVPFSGGKDSTFTL